MTRYPKSRSNLLVIVYLEEFNQKSSHAHKNLIVHSLTDLAVAWTTALPALFSEQLASANPTVPITTHRMTSSTLDPIMTTIRYRLRPSIVRKLSWSIFSVVQYNVTRSQAS